MQTHYHSPSKKTVSSWIGFGQAVGAAIAAARKS